MRIYRLKNMTMSYAWGSSDGLSRVLSLPNPSGGPLAELWMGAHPKAPSLVLMPEGPRRLDELIKADPLGTLGAPCMAHFGPALPFLFKALSAAKPLSIQVHPAKRKAERGYEKERESGILDDAENRNYKDPNHKPELSVALTSFEALCGFRPIDKIIEAMKILAPEDHRRFFGRLEKAPGRIELSVFFYSLMTQPLEERRTMVEGTARRIEAQIETGRVPEAEIAAWRWVRKLAALWPGDIGALSPLIFNYLTLEPGQAIFIAPAEPHAYLAGTALEIMANSDNVIRGALTEKHIDVPEFISVLSFQSGKPPLLAPVMGEDEEEVFPCPVADFSLARIGVTKPSTRKVEGPEILLCGEGQVEIESEGGKLVLARGESAFVRADARSFSVSGNGLVWRARTVSSALPGANRG